MWHKNRTFKDKFKQDTQIKFCKHIGILTEKKSGQKKITVVQYQNFKEQKYV